MLTYLKIENYALIESEEIEFSGGFTVFTGESGAGKSIVMSAIELLCGGRGGKEGIRSGCAKCTLSGIFSVPPELAEILRGILQSGGIDVEEPFREITLRRVITASSTRNFIDDVPVGAKLLSSVGAYLVDLHGANEQLSLTVPACQLALLDEYGKLSALRAQCASCCADLRALAAEREAFDCGLPDAAEADRLQLLAEEIDRIAPRPGEDEELAARQRRGASARQILETSAALSQALTESENSIADRLGEVFHQLSELEKIDASLTGELPSLCSRCQTEISDLSASIAAMTEKVDLDPEALAAVEARLGEIYTLKRRYGPTMEQLFLSREAAEKRLAEFRAAKERRSGFDAREKELRSALKEKAAELSRKRKESARTFLAFAVEKLKVLGFENARLQADFSETEPGAAGMDHLELLFSANSGEDLRPLRKIASSGELSRLMLALKTLLTDADKVPTVIFDEIDMNIGGQTANRVGDELRALGRKRQILCISHLAQVAARADEHFLVSKETRDGRTRSAVTPLSDRAPEIARMLGGGTSALQHAKALLAECRKR